MTGPDLGSAAQPGGAPGAYRPGDEIAGERILELAVAAEQHQAIAAAIESGDEERAESLMAWPSTST
ncbi:hypothetical protein [Streptomyces sp. NPDC020917]|uniref:hypothetical protein n=1 Tax=Streptomyces sp. NPDC020917 TaxID=3365102 RepID=UPI00379101B6